LKKPGKVRIDKLLVELGLAPTRQKAQSLIMAGVVLVDDAPAEKAGELVREGAAIRLKGEDHPYVGRGGLKLAHAIEHFGISPENKICMDVGASTGGFTDCLLKKGAKRVYAIDVGYGQLAGKIAGDNRVVVIDRTNIRTMGKDLVPDLVELAVIDVSFISLELVMPSVDRFLARHAVVVALVKPQFEVGKGKVGKGGIVRDPALHGEAITKAEEAGKALGWTYMGVAQSPICGAKGNKEFLMCFSKEGPS
jgi:23S rRNA (cytidine1920-2'-O)/16S rRNA (cytidine1409-2'-O)-methyltransferase